jgi:hypothetical protein
MVGIGLKREDSGIRIRERLERSKINTRGFRFLGLGGPCSPRIYAAVPHAT